MYVQHHHEHLCCCLHARHASQTLQDRSRDVYARACQQPTLESMVHIPATTLSIQIIGALSQEGPEGMMMA